MELDIISYADLKNSAPITLQHLEKALLQKGIVGVRHVPQFEKTTRAYIEAARQFCALPDKVKEQYAPLRDSGDVQGYELGVEKFKNDAGVWQIDDKKSSYYAFVPDHAANKWPCEGNLKSAYLALGELIFKTGKLILDKIGLNKTVGIQHDALIGQGRLLHYHKASDETNANPNWCGGHFDHGIFTGLVPAYYFRDGKEIAEPEEAGLHIVPSEGHNYEKIFAADKSVLLFQVGEFGQLLSNDRIKATKHIVKKAQGEIERFAFALFYIPPDDVVISSSSVLTRDARYHNNQFNDGSIRFGDWNKASFARYHAK